RRAGTGEQALHGLARGVYCAYMDATGAVAASAASGVAEATRAAQLLKAGNFVRAVAAGDPGDWAPYAALGLVGRTDLAVPGLERIDAPEARFYQGVAHWIDGDDARAERSLAAVDTPHARRLLELIRRPQIRVLAQLPWRKGDAWDLGAGLGHDGRFAVQLI